jgi:transketolase|tara:strand:+ start:720 stop:1472 length:753 start_codon:yes stop_codon:yes gene_type:complete
MVHEDLIAQAEKLRKDTFTAFVEQGEAHLGGSFSMIEMLIALYEKILKREDKFILSKAHASFPFCLFLKERGYDPPLTTHLEINQENGIHCTTGSLGHGLPMGTGMALARKLQHKLGKIYVMLSDGECQEGTTWESLLIAAKYHLDNLVVLVDYNKIQALTTLHEGLPIDNLAAKFRAFNWGCAEVNDGHSYDELVPVLQQHNNTGEPRAVIVHTTKGKGVKAFENDPRWHARKIKGEELEIGRRELGIA